MIPLARNRDKACTVMYPRHSSAELLEQRPGLGMRVVDRVEEPDGETDPERRTPRRVGDRHRERHPAAVTTRFCSRVGSPS
jgi:hypothetical protein